MKYKTIKEYSGYRFYENGSVKTCLKQRSKKFIVTDKWREQKLYQNKSGYWCFNLKLKTSKKSKLVHRLVCEAFHGPAPADKPLALHSDGDSLNNHFENLRWGTHKENMADAAKHGTTTQGMKNHCAKLNDEQVIKIRESEKIVKDLAENYKVSLDSIYLIISRKTWSHLPITEKEKHLRTSQK